METMRKTLLEFFMVIIAFFLAFGAWYMMTKNDSQDSDITIKRDTIYIPSKDTIHFIRIEKKAPVYITNNYTTEISKGIDTGFVLSDYFLKRGYIDTIRNDSVDIILHEEVYKNDLNRVLVGYKWKVPERIVKERITETRYPKSLFIGGSAGYFGKPHIGIYGGIETKKMGFGLIFDPFQKQGCFIISKRIKLKK